MKQKRKGGREGKESYNAISSLASCAGGRSGGDREERVAVSAWGGNEGLEGGKCCDSFADI